ncbi:MAG: heme biosynthesis protein HemY [Alphaproteobacteria bacterium]
MVIRGLIFLAGLALLSAAGAWVAENPGDVTILWRDYRVDTSVGAMLLGVGLLAAATAVLYRVWGGLWNMPRQLGRSRRDRRVRRGHLALAKGMVAVAAGDKNEARRQARRADELLDDPPLTLLLAAQAAQLEHDERTARVHFEAMLERPDTEFVGVRGLLMLAQRDGDTSAALELARRARRLNPRLPWVLDTLFDLQADAGLWAEAEETLRAASRQKALPAEAAAHRIAVVLLRRSIDAEMAEDMAGALAFARKARAADPSFLPSVLRLAWLWHGEGKERRARKLIEESWATAPHPELARIYRLAAPTTTATSAGDAMQALRALETLEKIHPGHREGHLAMARAALDADLWGETRRHLNAAGEPITAGICRLRAELIEAEGGEPAAAREWLAHATEADADPAWVCGGCGAVAEDWSARCGNCGAFDRLDWRAPPRVRALAPGEATHDVALGSAHPATQPAIQAATHGAAPGAALASRAKHPDGREDDGGEPDDQAEILTLTHSERE